MKWFSFRIFAISIFIFEPGMSTRRCFAPHALRMRVNISAIGSVMLIDYSSPARLAHAGNHSRKRELTETDSAHAELSQKGARTSAPAAAVVLPDAELRLPLALLYHGLSRHYLFSRKKLPMIISLRR